MEAMEEFKRGRSDTLDIQSEGEEMTPVTLVTTMTPDTEVNSEPSQAELAQCEAEVGTLLSIIAELNRKMGALQAPSDPDDLKPQEPVILPPAPASLSSPLPSLCNPEKHTGTASKAPVTNREGSGEVWSELQGVISVLEGSINTRRTWAASHTACGQDGQMEHLTAARDSWVQVTQVLEEMEREFGISYPSGLPPEERQQYQKDILALHQRNCDLRSSLQSRQEELEGAKVTVGDIEVERNSLHERLLGLHKAWRSGSLSPPYSSSGSSSGVVLSPGWASPGSPGSPSFLGSPPFPGSPLFLRRPIAMGIFPALSTGGDISSSASPSPSPWPGSVPQGSPCRSPSPSVSLEGETDRLQRCIERLKARNERLTAALDKRKGESELISMTLSRHEADSTALQMALQYCEECEEAYSELLSVYEGRRQQVIPHWRHIAGPVMESQQPNSPRPSLRSLRTEELSTSFSTPGGAVETETHIQTRFHLYYTARGTEVEGCEADIRERIERLKQDRAAVCVPKPGPGGEGNLSPDTGTLAGLRGSRGGQGGQDTSNPQSTKREKAVLLYDLVTVREEMSELRGLIRLTEKERRCLDWSLMAQKAQDAAGALISESLAEEIEDRRTEQQRTSENEDKLSNDGDIPGPQNRAILRELQAVLQREQVLKRRVSAVRESLDLVLSDSASRRRGNDEQMARLAQAHSKATGSYRNARRKYREKLWRLESQVSAMSDRHMTQIGALKATLEAMECRREETVL
ncbi:colorectal mutant cancer protein isoform X1 [Oncorhynchus nerka]|uniref:colorectal mutant cancer protein isoform X1 n=1 Tax=Oncorhynchus nerka TaxID=8023 RepID=UPI001130ECBB|nr:Usher syndrome type-1C protein-binding protein 1 isoform X1 [Oncorhynchus nerka]